MVRQKTVPIHHDLYRTNNIEEMVNERSKFIIHPPHPKGPKFFPPGKVIRTLGQISLDPLDILPDVIHLPSSEPIFTLDDFLIQTAYHIPLEVSQGTMSRENYLKLTSWYATNVPIQENLNTLDLEIDHEAPLGRVPRRQILIELQMMVKKVLEECASDTSAISSLGQLPSWPTPAPDDIIFKSATSRYFCGQARNNSPFDARHQPLISPSEAAVLECMMSGGSHLSLKAHFIDELPLLSPLARTLTLLNLSYNSFKEFPIAALELTSLIFLSLRNNPLRMIPSDIRCLQNLHFLCLSFCNLSVLPPSLFDLQQLMDLDVSYNNLHVIPRDICKLKVLHKLNIEGNQLSGLPASALCLHLSQIILGNNLMHPLLWRENARNQPQSLVDICCVVIRKTVQDIEKSPLPVLNILQRHSYEHETCDECQDRMFGPGLTVIRSVEHSHFHVRNLPFIFTVCSPRCRSLLAKKSAKFWLKKS